MAIDRNITININDTSPLANTAYVDAGKENKVYNKAQVNELVEDLREGTLGSVSPSQTLQQLNALPDGNYYASEAGTYAFGTNVPVGWQFRFNKTGTTWKVLTKVQIPMQDLTPLENRIIDNETKVDEFIENFAVEVDQEFIPTSENATSSKAVNDWLFGVEEEVIGDLKILGINTFYSEIKGAADRGYFAVPDKISDEVAKGKKLKIRCATAGQIYIKIYSVNGTTLVYKSTKINAVNIGMNEIDMTDVYFEKNDILYFGGVTIYVVLTPGKINYGSTYTKIPLNNTNNIDLSSINKADGYSLEYALEYNVIDSIPVNGKVVDKIDFSSSKSIPNVKAVMDYVGENKKNIITDIILIPSYGQSLSIGTNGGASTFTSPIDIAYNVNGVNSNVQDMNGGYIEMFKDMAKHYNYKLPSDFKIITCLGGAGGISISNLSKGTTYYNNILNNVRTAKATADSLGKTFSVPAFCWTQGEEDYRSGGNSANYGVAPYEPLKYAEKLIKLVDDLNADIKEITKQTIDVKCVMYQLACHNTYGRYPRIALEQLKASLKDNRIVLAKTMYDVDYNTADYVHAPNKTYRNMGNYYGIGLFEAIVNKKHYLPIYPIKHFIRENQIFIQFHVPKPPLKFDEALVNPLTDGNKGFNIYNVTNEIRTTATISQSSITIYSVEIYSEDTIKITLSGNPLVGSRLTYGVNGQGYDSINGVIPANARSGRVLGARGNLRDSQTYFNQVVDYFNLYNWCPIFEIIF